MAGGSAGPRSRSATGSSESGVTPARRNLESLVEEQEAMLAERDREIRELRTAAAERDFEIERVRAEVEGIKELQDDMERGYAERLAAELASRDNELADAKDSLAARDRELEEVQAQVASIRIELVALREEQGQQLATERQRQYDELDGLRRKHDAELQELKASLRRETDTEREALLRRAAEDREAALLRAKAEWDAEAAAARRQHESALADAARTADSRLEDQRRKFEKLYEQATGQMRDEFEQMYLGYMRDKQQLVAEKEQLARQLAAAEQRATELQAKNDADAREIQSLRTAVQEMGAASADTESVSRSLEARVRELEQQLDGQRTKGSDMWAQMQRAIEERDRAVEKLHKEELVRRKLHNQLQELKGNIRVFCRVRPAISAEDGGSLAKISYPDEDAEGQQILVSGPPAGGGNGPPRLHPFAFDKVFGAGASNSDIFEEISQLVQSALDGYNVCIFAYGQTGSGKTYTMSSPDGMIPRAVEQVFETAAAVRERGWKYELSGEFLEIYNENINDLLGRPDEYDRPRHEIRHDAKARSTTVTGLTTVELASPEMVATVLARANKNRSVAATNANERSSRSHSVFTLRIRGHNAATGRDTNGTLNLIDLAGSERLAHSGATGERLRETQAINKSLSCLGDVIHALSTAKEGSHIPYRNSKLTYLLQYSLSGDSKTLMFVNVSPLESSVSETVSSLRFAQKANNTKLKA